VVRRCREPTRPRYRRASRPEEAGHRALPQGEFGLEVLAPVGARRFAEQRSVPASRQSPVARGVAIAARTVTPLVRRHEEPVAPRRADQARLRARLAGRGRAILALDGVRPDVGHEVLRVPRDRLSGAVLPARSLLGSTAAELAPRLREVAAARPVPLAGVIADGQASIRHAVRAALPEVPQRLCQSHPLREAAKPIVAAARHAKRPREKAVRGVRPIERALEGRADAEADAIRGYCLARRSALTDDGRPPLCASGRRRHDRLAATRAPLARVAVQGGSRRNSPRASACSPGGARRRRTAGRPVAAPTAGSMARRTCSPTTPVARARRSAPTTRRCSRRWSPGKRPWTRWLRRSTSSRRCPPATPHGASTATTCPSCRAPTTPWRTSSARRATMSGAPAAAGVPRRGASCAGRSGASAAARLRRFDATERRPDDRAGCRAQRRFRRAPDAYLSALEQQLSQPVLPP